jgi:hypothetical protein
MCSRRASRATLDLIIQIANFTQRQVWMLVPRPNKIWCSSKVAKERTTYAQYRKETVSQRVPNWSALRVPQFDTWKPGFDFSKGLPSMIESHGEFSVAELREVAPEIDA